MRRTISVVGLGYIGLPLSLCFCEKGFRVIGVDVNPKLIDDLKRGHTEVHEMYGEETLDSVLKRNLENGNFIPTANIRDAAADANAYVITVGLPVARGGELVETVMIKAAEQLGEVVKPGDLLLFRSTVVPGFLEEKVIPILREKSGLEPGKDFHFAYAAERVAEGRAMLEFQTLDIVMAGLTDKCADKAEELLGQLTSGTIHRTNLRIAQAVKVIENAQRDVNIALAQEVAKFAEYHDVDVFELIRMANTHPRVKLLEPGIGVGGFCIPNAFHYLNGSLREGQKLPLFELARDVNDKVPNRIVEKLKEKLALHGKSLRGSTIALFGLGMKDFSNDIRLSPATALAEQLISEGATVQAYDPTVSHQLDYQVDSLEACMRGADGLVVATWQHGFESMDLRSIIEASHVQDVIVDIKHRLDPFLGTERTLPNPV